MLSIRRLRGAAALVMLTSSLIACGGPPASAIMATADPGTGAQPTTATQPSVDPGGGATSSNPPITIAAFTGGTFHAEVTGVVTTTLDYPLLGGQSIIVAGATIFAFGDASGAGVSVAITDEGNTLTISAPEVSVAGGNVGADTNRCTITVTRADVSGVAGTFQCADLVAVYDNLSKNGNVNLTGTFEATP